MIGGTDELLNATNRLKLPAYLLVYPINRPVRMFPAEVPQEVTDQARSVAINCLHLADFNCRFNVGLARHFGLTQEGVLAVVLLALQPSEVVQVTSVMSYWIFGNLTAAGAELSAQRGPAEGSLLLLADLPFPGSFSYIHIA